MDEKFAATRKSDLLTPDFPACMRKVFLFLYDVSRNSRKKEGNAKAEDFAILTKSGRK